MNTATVQRAITSHHHQGRAEAAPKDQEDRNGDMSTTTKALRRVKLLGFGLGITVNKRDEFNVMMQPDTVPVAGASVDVSTGAPKRRITATRVAALGPLALLAKKDTTKVYITIEGTDGSVLVRELPSKKEKDARVFAAAVNSLQTQTSQDQSQES